MRLLVLALISIVVACLGSCDHTASDKLEELVVENQDPRTVVLHPYASDVIFMKKYPLLHTSSIWARGYRVIDGFSEFPEHLQHALADESEVVDLSRDYRLTYTPIDGMYVLALPKNGELLVYGNRNLHEATDFLYEDLKRYEDASYSVEVHVFEEPKVPLMMEMQELAKVAVQSRVGVSSTLKWSEGGELECTLGKDQGDGMLKGSTLKLKLPKYGIDTECSVSLQLYDSEDVVLMEKAKSRVMMRVRLQARSGLAAYDQKQVEYAQSHWPSKGVQKVNSYLLRPDFIRFLLDYAGEVKSEKEEQDPFSSYGADLRMWNQYTQQYRLKKFVQRRDLAENRSELEAIEPPVLGSFFSADDRVYDARHLLQKFDIETEADGWLIFNESKSALHGYKMKNPKQLELLANAYMESYGKAEGALLARHEMAAAKVEEEPQVQSEKMHLFVVEVPWELAYRSRNPIYLNAFDPFAEDSKEVDFLKQSNRVDLYPELLRRISKEFPRAAIGMSLGDQCVEMTDFLQDCGITLKNGWAILNTKTSDLICYGSSKDLDLVDALTDELGPDPPSNLLYQVHLVESEFRLEESKSLEGVDYSCLASFAGVTLSGMDDTLEQVVEEKECTLELVSTVVETGTNADVGYSLRWGDLDLNAATVLTFGVPSIQFIKQVGEMRTYLVIQMELVLVD